MRYALVAALAFVVLGCSSDAPAARSGASVVKVTVDSKAVGQKLPLSIVLPAGGGEGRPLVVFLHGRGQSAASFLRDPFFAALKKLGDRAPIVAFPYGGDHSYWHNRDDGDWGRYVMKEVIPRAIEESGADPDRIAIGGISMGGFGAYDLALRNRGRFCGVAGHSPALWQSSGETAPGAFDDAADFARHNVVGKAAKLSDENLWLDAGRSDPFIPGDRAFSAASGAKLHLSAGGHDGAYWDAHWLQYLRFYARAFRDCA